MRACQFNYEFVADVLLQHGAGLELQSIVSLSAHVQYVSLSAIHDYVLLIVL